MVNDPKGCHQRRWAPRSDSAQREQLLTALQDILAELSDPIFARSAEALTAALPSVTEAENEKDCHLAKQVLPSSRFDRADHANDPRGRSRDTKNGEDEKLVVYFKGQQKGLALNRTNFDAIVTATGEDDTDNWPGYQIELYPSTTEMNGCVVDCVRVRAPAQGTLAAAAKGPRPKPPTAPTPAVLDDDIPF